MVVLVHGLVVDLETKLMWLILMPFFSSTYLINV